MENSKNNKIRKPGYAKLIMQLIQVLPKNYNKVFMSLMMFAILGFVLSIIASIPPVVYLISSNFQINGEQDILNLLQDPVFSKIMIFLSYFMIFILLVGLYGFVQITLRIVDNKHVTLGYLFQGFRNAKRIFVCALLFVILFVASRYIPVLLSKIGFVKKLLGKFDFIFIIALQLILVSLFFSPLIFSYYIFSDNQNMGVFSAIKESARLMKGRFFHFVGFVVVSGGVSCLVSIILTAVSFFIPENLNMVGQFISFVISILRFIFSVNAAVQISLGIPFYYNDIAGKSSEIPTEIVLDV